MKRRMTKRFGVGLLLAALGAAVILPRLGATGFSSPASKPCPPGRRAMTGQQRCDDDDTATGSHGSTVTASGRSGHWWRASEDTESAGHAGFGESASAHASGGG